MSARPGNLPAPYTEDRSMHPFAYTPAELADAIILAVRCVLHVYSSGTPCVPV